MSIDYTTYIGPYVHCTTKKVTSTRTIRTCCNNTCSEFSRELYDLDRNAKKFCDRCGSPVENRDLPITVDNVNAHDVRMELLDEALYDVPGDSFHFWMRDNNVHIWLANRHVPGARDFSFDSQNMNIQYVPITAEMIAIETTQFSDFFEKEISILREEYGSENVEVQWGLIHYIS